MDILNERLTVDGFIAHYGEQYPLLLALEGTIQDPEWHAEGNVKIHVDMVIAESYQLIKQHGLDDRRAKILLLAALFHDYGKPITTKEKEINGVVRIAAPDHETKGASLLLLLSPPAGITQQDWLEIVQLTAFHHLPKWLVVREGTKADYAALTRKVDDIELLYLLELADMRGRVCSDKQDQLDIMSLFKMMAEENGIWHKNPYADNLSMVTKTFPLYAHPVRIAEQMASRYEDGQIFMLEEELSRAYGYMEGQPHLVILCGLPGSGKSTYIEANFNLEDYVIISLDEIRAHHFGLRADQSNNDEVVRIAHKMLKELLRERKNVIWDATNFRKDFRSKICQLGFDYKAYVEILVKLTPVQVAIKQNKHRVNRVPVEVILDIANKFQMPSVDEGHALTFLL